MDVIDRGRARLALPHVDPPKPPPAWEFTATLYRGALPAALFRIKDWPLRGWEVYLNGEPLHGPASRHYSLNLKATPDACVDPAGIVVGVSGIVTVDGLVLGWANGYGARPIQPYAREVTDWPTHVVRMASLPLADAPDKNTAEVWTLAIRRSL